MLETVLENRLLKTVSENGLLWLYKLTIIVLEKVIDVLETILEKPNLGKERWSMCW